MRDANFYTHDVSVPIEVVQTHISYVVLTGPYAYKIKKPIDLGFLNFTTLEKRHHYCDEELRLNQAFAPDLYVDVLPIYEHSGIYALSPSDEHGEIAEYAVRMRQFDDADLLINVFDRGELDRKRVEDLGIRVAEIHRNAPVVSRKASYGGAQAMAESVQMNFETIQPFAGTVIPEARLQSLRTFMDTFIAKHEWLFELRIKEGHIRECHGDLHLRNICLHEGHIELFDRIEFNETFKNIDVMYDLAFLLMDVRYRGRNDLANRILNTYLEATGDYAGAQLLPFYQSVRALIRAEVALLISVDQQVENEGREQASSDGLRYLEHALQYFDHSKGRIFATCGLSGAGKSTIAVSLRDRVDAIHIRSDVIRKHLAGVELSERGQDIYSESYTRATYAKLIELGIVLAAHGHTVILDAKFDRRDARQKLIEKAESFELPLHFIYCHAPLDVLKARLMKRKGDVSDATEALTDTQVQQFEVFEGDETALRVSLDTQDKESVEAVLNELLNAD